MDANDQRLIEGLFARIDRLVAIMEGKYLSLIHISEPTRRS